MKIDPFHRKGARWAPSAFRRPMMTKTTNKTNPSTKESALPTVLVVLGFDDKQKPRGARCDDAKPDLVSKAAQAMELRVYEAKSSELAELAKKLPVGRLYAS